MTLGFYTILMEAERTVKIFFTIPLLRLLETLAHRGGGRENLRLNSASFRRRRRGCWPRPRRPRRRRPAAGPATAPGMVRRRGGGGGGGAHGEVLRGRDGGRGATEHVGGAGIQTNLSKVKYFPFRPFSYLKVRDAAPPPLSSDSAGAVGRDMVEGGGSRCCCCCCCWSCCCGVMEARLAWV